MIKNTLAAAWGDQWWDKFGPEYPKERNLEAPFIAYRILGREPSKAIPSLKPRWREEIPDPERPDYPIIIVGQNFDVLIQFDIFALTAKDANDIAAKFEDFMLTYTGLFKSEGIQEILFERQLEDDYDPRWREDYYVRSLVYYVRIEKITPVPAYLIEQMHIKVSRPKEEPNMRAPVRRL